MEAMKVDAEIMKKLLQEHQTKLKYALRRGNMEEQQQLGAAPGPRIFCI